jgi:hypothetical protein
MVPGTGKPRTADRMAASHGDGSLSGGVHGDSLQAIAQYFKQRSCRQCSQPYTREGIEFLRQEPGVIVVRVACVSCGHPLGIALVGMNTAGQQGTCQHGRPAAPAEKKGDRYPSEWTKRDADRLGSKPPISYDDVLNAHEFFASLGDDWSRNLPKGRQKNAS